MIFEVLNESLNYYRTYGIKGKFLPWITNSKKINQKPINNELDLANILEESVSKVLTWGSCLCGFIAENIQSGENLELEKEYLEQIREDRLAIMLEQELQQNEY